MPRRLTRPEAITRIAITALHAAFPAMTSRQLVGFFHVSPRTVTEATSYSIISPRMSWKSRPMGEKSRKLNISPRTIFIITLTQWKDDKPVFF